VPRVAAADMTDLTFTVGDRGRPIRALLLHADGTPIDDLETSTITFRMVAPDGAAKVDDAAALVEDPDAGAVRYDWTAADVDTVGEFFAWFRREQDGLTETFPPDGRTLRVRFANPR
jgi:hypothetical protein